uniref:Mutator-like transposase domain-containing protein n=1 Tax=Homalodisca liturata TaxID=320908 RepID=A0A1B6K2H0_9HEMI
MSTQSQSSSSKKINIDKYEMFNCDENYDNEIINMQILSDQLFSSSLCKNCKKSGLQVRAAQHFGLAFEMEIYCCHCKYVHKFNSSRNINLEKKTLFDVNIRLVYGLRSIGKGMAAGKMLCGVMNLPQPPTKPFRYNKFLKDKAKQVMDESMKTAVDEAVEENKTLGKNERDLKVGIDGTWQRRGFSSLNGIVTCTSVDTGKVMDIEVLSKFCNCLDKQQHEAICSANYQGSSGGMESAGALAIFHRSVNKYNVRYLEYLGDGDTNSFKTIADSKPYGEVEIQKLECIGHIQKRMGSRLRKLKRDSKGVTLSDGGKLGGKNRLTDGIIDQLQTYYGNAIRKNTDNLQNMKAAVWAIYFHKLSTDDNPQHGLCPSGENTWCKYNKAKHTKEPYSHKNSIPSAIMLALKPIFQALANPDLLRKCLHGKTQNVNESINNVIWSRVPKKDFVTLNTLEFGAYDAISTFNDGNIAKCKMLRAVGIEPCKRTIDAMKSFDYERVRRANCAISDFQRQARRQTRNLKRRIEEDFEEEPAYDPGMH